MESIFYFIAGSAFGYWLGMRAAGHPVNWKKALLAFLIAAVVAFGITYLRGTSGGGPVVPSALKPGATEFGSLRVTVLALGQPVEGVEVDVGTMTSSGPTGAMTVATTGADGVALFEQVPVGTFDIFWNLNVFPKGYQQPSGFPVTIVKNQTTAKTVTLTPVR